MKWSSLFAACALVAGLITTAPSWGQSLTRDWDIAGRDVEHVYTHQGYERGFWVHLPPGYDGTQDLPVVVALHGGVMDPYLMADYTNLHEKANQENFIVVFAAGLTGVLDPLPAYGELATGQSFLGLRSWNAGYCCGRPYDEGIDDAEFLRTVVDEISASYAADESRIYLTGLSNGAGLTYLSGLQDGDRFAAIAPVAGGIPEEMFTDYAAYASSGDGRVPVAIVHGKLDTNRPYYGGQSSQAGSDLADPQTPDFLPVEEIAARFASANGCTATTITAPQAQSDPDLANVTTIAFSGCDTQAGVPLDVVLYAVEDGGHAWPGGDDTLVSQAALGAATATPDTNNLIWAFFLAHSDPSIAQVAMTFSGRGRVNDAGVRPDLLTALDYAVKSLLSSTGLKRRLFGLMEQPDQSFARSLSGFVPRQFYGVGDMLDLMSARLDLSLASGISPTPLATLGFAASLPGAAALQSETAAPQSGPIAFFGGTFDGEGTFNLTRTAKQGDAVMSGGLGGLRIALNRDTRLTAVAAEAFGVIDQIGPARERMALDAMAGGALLSHQQGNWEFGVQLLGLQGKISAFRGSPFESAPVAQAFDVSRSALTISAARAIAFGGWQITPKASLESQTTRFGGYDEQGGTTRLLVSSSRLSSVSAKADATLSTAFKAGPAQIALGFVAGAQARLFDFGAPPQARFAEAPGAPSFALPALWGPRLIYHADLASTVRFTHWRLDFQAGRDAWSGPRAAAEISFAF